MASEKLEQQMNETYIEQVIAGENYIETAVAFANGRGGKILFYMERDMSNGAALIGKLNHLVQEIYDAIESHIFPRIGIETQAGQPVLVAEILPGMEKPYYVKSKGMFDGTYVRSAGQTKLAEPYQVQELLLAGTNGTFDQLAVKDTADEDAIQEFCEMLCSEREKHAEDPASHRVNKEDLLQWKLLIEEGDGFRKTNAWKLLEGSAEQLFPEGFIQCAVYRGINRADFVTGAEFDGPLAKQFEEAAAYLAAQLGEEHAGLQPALRRLLARAVCQRSYLAPGRISVVVYADRIEFTIPALLEEDMTIWKLKTGFSKVRNRAIMAAFAYMGILDDLSSSLPELYRTAKQEGCKEPSIITLGEDVRINIYIEKETLEVPALVESPLTEEDIAIEEAAVLEAEAKENPAEDQNALQQEPGEAEAATVLDFPLAADEMPMKKEKPARKAKPTKQKKDAPELMTLQLHDAREDRMIELMREKPRITQSEMKDVLGLSIATIKRMTASLTAQGIVTRSGSNRNGRWEIAKPKKRRK
ncbi:hypothetical protein TAMA11512_16550 [Selenomonas sp. TAMA-11512]|uniref:ATP-binding protein n=1 Tax=Selenomonas sp. TAMA-11512 TaxID=3095337 RepID=UPI0030885C99|nr:hypothetical protein TAMA11512_16550 [Selenomonas sp. TAMA-11512]